MLSRVLLTLSLVAAASSQTPDFTSSTFGGSAIDTVNEVTIDFDGSIIVVGSTSSADFPVMNPAQATFAGEIDAFVARLDPTGQSILSSTYLGGSGDDRAFGVAIADNGDVLVSGNTASPNFPVSNDAHQRNYGGGATDGFLARLSPGLDQISYATFAGGGGDEEVGNVGRDAAGNIYIGGQSNSISLATTPGAAQTAKSGGIDGWLRKYDPTGTTLLYSTFYGGLGDDQGRDFAVLADGTAYLAGWTTSVNLPTTAGAFQDARASNQDGFLARFSPDGSTLEYGTYVGGNGDDFVNGIDANEAGFVYLAGATASANFPQNPDTPSPYNGGPIDALLITFQFPPAALLSVEGVAQGTLQASYFNSELCCDAGSRIEVFVDVAAPDASAALLKTGAGQKLQNGDGAKGAISGFENSTGGPRANNFEFTELGVIADQLLSGEQFNPACVYLRIGTIVFGGESPNADGQVAIRAPIINVFPTDGSLTNGLTAGDPISTATRELYERVTHLRGGGIPDMRLQAAYGSNLAASGITSAAGENWMLNTDAHLVFDLDSVTVVLYPGRRIRFVRDGAQWRLAEAEQLLFQLVQEGESFRFADPLGGAILSFDSQGRGTRIEDRAGNALAIAQGPNGPTEMTDGVGRTYSYSYDGGGFLTEVRDQAGRAVMFTHDAGNLVSTTAPDGGVSRYEYAPGGALLTTHVQPNGNRPFTQEFDAGGSVTSQSDSASNETTISTAAGVTTITDPLGSVTRHAYDAVFNISGITDGEGNTYALTYDANNRVTGVAGPEGTSASAAYDANGNITSATNAAGSTTRFSWLAQTQGPFTFFVLSQVTLPDGGLVRLSYDPRGNLLSVTDPATNRTALTYDERGRPLTVTNPRGGVTTRTYNNDNTTASLERPSGDTLRFSYDDAKRLTQITLGDDSSVMLVYDPAGRTTSVTGLNGRPTQLAYDDNGNLVSLTDPSGAQAAATFDDNGRLTSVRDALDAVTRLSYDAAGNLSRTTNAVQGSTSYGYDANNRVVSLTDPASQTVSVERDGNGRVTAITDPLGRKARIARDKGGRPTQSTTPSGRAFAFAYDPLNRLKSASNPLGEQTALAYDPRGLLTSTTLPGGLTTTLTLDNIGAISSIRDPGGSEWAIGSDAAGRVTSTRDPLGRDVTLEYDQLSRLSRVASPEGSADLVYDADGNLSQAAYSDGGQLAFAYDANNRLVSANGFAAGYDLNGRLIDSNGLAIGRDAAGRMTAITYAPNRTLRYVYDARGLPIQIVDWVGGTTELTWDAAGQLSSIARPNGTVTRFSYDQDGRVTRIAEDGLPDGPASSDLQLDAASRLTMASGGLGAAASLAAGSESYSFDAAHQLGEGTHDALGRLLSAGDRRFTWNLADRLTSYSAGGVVVSSSYDAFGLRISRTAGGAAENHVWNYGTGLPSLAVVRSGGSDRRYYVYLPNGVLLYSIEAVDGARAFYHYDSAGNTSALSDDGAGVITRYFVSPYGEIVSQSGAADNPFTFGGALGVMQEGDSGLYYMRLRYYDAMAARFVSKDPIRQIDPRQANPYSFARGNPLGFADPTGAGARGGVDGVLSELGAPLSPADTIVRRLEDKCPTEVGDSVTIDVELVALSLVSCEPITVLSTSPALFDVAVSLNEVSGNPLTITLDEEDCGTFDSNSPVVPRFSFIRTTSGSGQFVDCGERGQLCAECEGANGDEGGSFGTGASLVTGNSGSVPISPVVATVSRTLDIFFDIFNITDRSNFNNPTGDLRSGNFLNVTSLRGGSGFPRQGKFGIRFGF